MPIPILEVDTYLLLRWVSQLRPSRLVDRWCIALPMTYRDRELESVRTREQLEGDLEAALSRDQLKRRRVVAMIYGTLAVIGAVVWLWAFWWQLRPEPGDVLATHMEMLESSTLGLLWTFGMPIAIFIAAARFGHVAFSCTRELAKLGQG